MATHRTGTIGPSGHDTRPGHHHPALSPCGPVLAGHTTLAREEGMRHGWGGAGKTPPSTDPAIAAAYETGYRIGAAGRAKKERGRGALSDALWAVENEKR